MALKIDYVSCEYGWIVARFSGNELKNVKHFGIIKYKDLNTQNKNEISPNKHSKNAENLASSSEISAQNSSENPTKATFRVLNTLSKMTHRVGTITSDKNGDKIDPYEHFNGSDDEFFELNISEVFDPFNDWFFALEHIDKDEPPSFVIDTEGPCYEINLHNAQFGYKFTISYFNESGEKELIFACGASRDEIVQQMFVRLMDFVHSDKYDFKHYENWLFEDSWSGFRLSKYRNQTLENYAKFGVKPRYERAHCRFCESKIHSKNIYDMLKKAYDVIIQDKRVCDFLQNTLYSTTSPEYKKVGICQNSTRLHDKGTEYRIIQESTSDIYLCFSEDFGAIERIEIRAACFKFKPRHQKYYQICTDERKLEFLRQIFSLFTPYAQNLGEILGDDNGRLLDENGDFIVKTERLKHYNDFSVFGDDKARFLFKQTNRAKKLVLQLFSDYKISENLPISEWLNQDVIIMQPDFGEAYLWSEPMKNLGFECLKGYEYLANSVVDEDLKAWANEYQLQDREDFSWILFNKKGREEWEFLQKIVQNKFIVIYRRGFNEMHGTDNESEQIRKMHECEFLLEVYPDFCSSGIWLLKGGNIDYDYLALPKALAAEFEAWQKIYDDNALSNKWEKISAKFYEKGYKLAKKLKAFLGDRAFVQYGDKVICEF